LIRKELLRCQAVLPSLDTLLEQECSVLNQPCCPLDPGELAQDILRFAREFSGRLFLEILLVAGYNDSEENLERLRGFCRELRPHRIDVVTMSRPGACLEARPVAEETLRRWRSELEPLAAGAEPDSGYRAAPFRMRPESREEVLASLRRRPQSRSDLMAGLGIEGSLVDEILRELRQEGLISELDLGQTTYFKPVGSG
jgi:wyosine [tRNA(Phe)-imidazoG37] synthetase (radical SAM superfamily)